MFLNYLLVLSIHRLSSLGITPNSSPWVICLHSGWLPNKLSGSVFLITPPLFSTSLSVLLSVTAKTNPHCNCPLPELGFIYSPSSSDTFTGSQSSI